MCSQSARQPESVAMQTNNENHAPKLPTPAANGNTSGKRVWECNVPEISIQDLDDRQMPEMPNLESVLAKSLQSVRKNGLFISLCIYLF